MKKRVRAEVHDDDRYEADVTRLKSKDWREQEQSRHGYRQEVVYAADLDDVLSMFTKSLEADKGEISHKYDFYHACLDRIDILLTEKNSVALQSQMLEILRRLSYFRPKQIERSSKLDQAYGQVSRKENVDDLLSQRHRELM